MRPSKKNLLKPKEASLDPSIKVETHIIELPKDENKLFDEEDDVGASIVPDLSLPSEDEEEELKPNNVWEYAIDVLFKLSRLHPEEKSLRKWVKYQDIETKEHFHQWNKNDITIGEPHTSYLENSWDKSNLEFLKTNSTRNLHMLWKYLYHLARKTKESSTTGDPYSFMLPDQFFSLSWREFMSWRLEDSNQSTCSIPSDGHRGYTKQDTRHESNQIAYQSLAFKKSIKREVSQYTILKDEKYFEACKRNLLVTATTHDCEEILDGNYKPENNTKNSSNRRNTSCTVFSTRYYKVTWVKP